MKYIFLLLFPLLYSCVGSQSEIDNNDEYESSQPSSDCNGADDLIIEFRLEDYASEGAEGKITFLDDTTLSKIEFSYATSNTICNQEYQYSQNRLVLLKISTNILNEDRTDYLRTDSLVLKNDSIFKNRSFDRDLFNKLEKLVRSKNNCWEPKQY